MWIQALAILATSRTVFVDPEEGSDMNSGSSAKKAWRTLEPLKINRLRDGDQLLIAGNTCLRANLSVRGLSRIKISSFGQGRATLDGGAGSALTFERCNSVRVERLRIVGAGRTRNDGYGLATDECNEFSLVDTHVAGFRLGGVLVRGGTKVSLDRVLAFDNGAAGIEVSSSIDGLVRSRDLKILDCRAVNNAGDPKNLTNHSGNGIVVGGVDDCEIAYCEATNNGWAMPRKGNGPVGIWAWNASRVSIHHCVSHHNKSPGMDGGGFDFDGGVTDSVMHSNLSYCNMGTGYLLCQYQQGGTWKNNIFRDNISFEDGSKNTSSGFALYLPDGMSNMSDAVVEHNVVLNSKIAVSTIGDIPRVNYRGNIFIAGGEILKLSWSTGGFYKSTFERNLAWSPHLSSPKLGKDSPVQTPTEWKARSGLLVDPKLRLPRTCKDLPTDPRQIERMAWFSPLKGSPCIENGRVILGVRRDH